MKRVCPLLLAAALALAGCASRSTHGTTTRRPADPATSTIAPLRVTTGSPAIPPASASDAVFQNPALVAHILATARSEVQTVNSYDYRRLAAYRSAAAAVTTGALHTQVLNTIDNVVAPDAPRQQVTQIVQVTDVGFAAIDTAQRDATVMAVGTLTVRNQADPAGRTNPFYVIAGIRLAKDRIWKLDRLANGGSTPCAPPGTSALRAACAAADTGLVAMTSYSRANFPADFARATALTTGDLRAQLVSQRQRALGTLLRGGYDTTGKVVASAVEYTLRTQVVILVALDSYRSGSAAAVPSTVRVTVVRQRGAWLLSKVDPAGTP